MSLIAKLYNIYDKYKLLGDESAKNAIFWKMNMMS